LTAKPSYKEKMPMQRSEYYDDFETTASATSTAGSVQVAELAFLIDAMPPEFREEVLLSVLWLGTSNVFQESYLVSSIRNQLADCLIERTGTLHDLRAIDQLALVSIRRQLTAFTAASEITQIIVAIHTLLDLLVDAL
jgi:hypothetical protein